MQIDLMAQAEKNKQMKNPPQAVMIARSVLSAIGAGQYADIGVDSDSADFKQLQKLLPGLAVALDKAEETVTDEVLLSWCGEGIEAINAKMKQLRQEQKPSAPPPRDYDSIVAKLKTQRIESVHKVFTEYPQAFLNNAQSNLFQAARYGLVDIVEYLHQSGVDIRANNGEALRMAASNGHLDVVQYLHQNGASIFVDNDWALRYAAKNGHLDMVQYLHQHGADIRTNDDWAMRLAAQNGHLDIVQYLHQNGANIRTNNDEALRSAAGSGHLDVVQYLHQNGANIRACGNWALSKAAENGHLDIVQYLHQNGANIRDYDDEALCKAAQYGHLSVVQYLHQNGAYIRVDAYGALRLAAMNNCLDVVRYILAQKPELADECSQRLKDQLARYELWQSVARTWHCGLTDLQPDFFRPLLFEAALAALKKEAYKGDAANQYAYQACLFSTVDQLWDYLERWGNGAAKTPLHDLLQHIKMPQNSAEFDRTAWADAVLRHGPKMARLVKFADKISQPLKGGDGGWSYSKTYAEAANFAYKRGREYPQIAGLAFDFLWQEEDFEKAVKLSEEYLAQHSANDNRKPANIPDIEIDGSVFGKEGYRFSKLPDGDVRGLFLGEFTDNCQHLASQGAPCAKHGFMSPHAGFYIVENDQGEIIAQSWAWRGEKGELVLDSFESLSGHFNAQQVEGLLNAFADRIDNEQIKSLGGEPVRKLRIGTGGKTPKMSFERASKPSTPVDYKGYRDSKNQYKIRKFKL